MALSPFSMRGCLPIDGTLRRDTSGICHLSLENCRGFLLLEFCQGTTGCQLQSPAAPGAEAENIRGDFGSHGILSTAENPEEFADIVWSSSGSDLSDDENKILISRLYNQKSHDSKAQKSYSKNNLLSEDRSSEGEPQFIDWEKDSDPGDGGDECNGSGKDDSALDISDSDSCASSNSLPVEEKEGELPKLWEYY
ncbi:hypothetical protein UY3_06099 [Chelonia mydas]|uniref:DUF4502 domain-containing protein n=1 Tax=Chelonia mydas TaxID=8469 RepID=M7BHM7_CHEMY|nr:hypothetical protein UY3_06099 [Chelonia mydas]